MATVSAVLKRFETTITAINIIEMTLYKLIQDTHSLRNIISKDDRYALITNDIMDMCESRNFDQELVLIAIKNMMDSKSDYPDITDSDWDMLSKIKVVK